MEEINLEELFKFFMSKVKYIILAIILCLGMGFIYCNYILTPMYHSSTTLILVSNNNQQNSTMLQSDLNVNKNLVSTYSEIVKSRSVLSKVIKENKLDYSVSELSQKISVSSVENTEIIKIQVSDKNNEVAQSIAKKTASIFMKEVQKIYNLSNISIVDEASLESDPYNYNLVKQLGIFAFIGLGLSVSVLFVIFYFDTTIKSSKDIEEKLGLPVVGNVALIEKKGDK